MDSERITTLALLIHSMHEEYLNRTLKRGGKDFLSGLIEAYAIVATDDPTDNDAAFAAALAEARLELGL